MSSQGARILCDGLVFAEGPRWRRGTLWLSDMFGGRVHRIHPDGRCETVLEIDGRPSGLAPHDDGTFWIVSMRDQRILRLRTDGTLDTLADLSGQAGGDLNDMVLHPGGFAYVGNFGFDLFGGAEPALTQLHRVDADGSVVVVAEELNFPNGMVVTPDGGTLIVAETFGHRLTAFDIAADGTLAGRRVFAELGERTPDGICLDAEGAVWVSSFVTGEFVRVREGGEVAQVIALDGRRATACTLGGDDLRTLCMITADTDIERLAGGDSSARVEQQRVAVAGCGSP